MGLRSKIVLLVITLFCMAAVPMSAIADFYVDINGDNTTGDGTSDAPWKTIGYAVSQVNDGDTIIVMDGEYPENIDIDKQLTIKSENGPSSTIVTAADPNDYTIYVTADNVTIEGLTISGATEIQMAGIYLYSSDNSSVLNNICSGSDNGIYLYYSDNINVSNNTCSDNTYGIYLYRSDGITISTNDCNTNVYGILVEGSTRIAITGNTCSGNDSVGIKVLPSEEVTISNNTCEDNNYGLYFLYYTGYYTIDDLQSFITGNTLDNNNEGQYYFADISNTQDSSSDSTCFIKSARCL